MLEASACLQQHQHPGRTNRLSNFLLRKTAALWYQEQGDDTRHSVIAINLFMAPGTCICNFFWNPIRVQAFDLTGGMQINLISLEGGSGFSLDAGSSLRHTLLLAIVAFPGHLAHHFPCTVWTSHLHPTADLPRRHIAASAAPSACLHTLIRLINS